MHQGILSYGPPFIHFYVCGQKCHKTNSAALIFMETEIFKMFEPEVKDLVSTTFHYKHSGLFLQNTN